MSHRFIRRTRAGVAFVALGIVGILIGGCAVTAGSLAGVQATPHAQKPEVRAEVATTKTVRIFDNVQFGEADGEPLQLDLCMPGGAVTPSVEKKSPGT